MTMKVGIIALGVLVIIWLGVTTAQVGVTASEAVSSVLAGS
jgi:hypothetical protein